MVIDCEGQTLVIGLQYRIGQFGAVAGMYGHPAFAPGPASLVVVNTPKPEKAVQYVQSPWREHGCHPVEVVEEFAVGSDVERAEQHIGEVERPETAIEVSHVAKDKRALDAQAPRLFTAKFDHFRAQIEPAIDIAPFAPFLQIGCGTGAELENPTSLNCREFLDCGFVK